MAARDQRSFQKASLIAQGFHLISLGLNVPGFPKSNGVIQPFFQLIAKEFTIFLKAHRIGYVEEKCQVISDAAGDLLLIPSHPGNLEIIEIKGVCEKFEMQHPCGRFIDADCMDANGEVISSGKSKPCFICKDVPAIECRRLNVHPMASLQTFQLKAMATYLSENRRKHVTKRLAEKAIQALLYEISLTPKPGLVDKSDSGSHKDMDFRLFMDSTASLGIWFEELALSGYQFGSQDPKEALPLIRAIGLKMEIAMFRATGGVNTQKGLIFLMGLALFGTGWVLSQNDRFEAKPFRDFIRRICKNLTSNELNNDGVVPVSHGEIVYMKYLAAGARGEAELGFPLVFDYGLPVLEGAAKPADNQLIHSFLAIAAVNEDTNILYRKGKEVLDHFKGLCHRAHDHLDATTYGQVTGYCLQEQISPGGSADLLAVTIFIHALLKEGIVDLPELKLISNDF